MREIFVGETGMVRAWIACIAVASLAACDAHVHGVDTPPPVASLAILDALSVINTQKTLDDHVVGWVIGRDCSTVRASRGEPYCEEIPQPVPSVVRTAYCYKSLASVSCFDRPLMSDANRYNGSRSDNIPIDRR